MIHPTLSNAACPSQVINKYGSLRNNMRRLLVACSGKRSAARPSTANDAQLVHRVMDQDDAAGFWTWLPITDSLLAVANKRFRQLPASVYLRTADAIHLSCASAQGLLDIYSNDRHLLAAAPQFNLTGKNVI